MPVRLLDPSEISRFVALRCELWPEQSPEDLAVVDPNLIVFVAVENEVITGFLEMDLRSYAEGCDGSPVPYVEGWYVAAEHRRRGIGGALMNAAEEWSREHGYMELGSDTEEFNRLSRDAHAALGFDEVETIVVFRKAL
jgi:aminoglycoside 6'-N-acetyltransferase I